MYRKNKSKISGATWNEEFQLPNGSYSIPNIQIYFECIIKKHEAMTKIRSVEIYINIIQNRITFKIKFGYCHGLLTSKTMNLNESTEEKKPKKKNGENVPHIEYMEVVEIHCNIANSKYQYYSWILSTFFPDKSFGELLSISPANHII